MATRRTRRPTQNGEQAPRLRMKDVAAKAGVSSATVSRVLNGADYVQPEYKERVLQAIAELGYRPNRLASNLRRSKTDMIGVVVPDIENPHFTEMVRAVEDAAYRLGYRVLLCNTDEADDKQASYLEMLAQERVLGIILTPCDANGQEISKVMDAGTPLVAFDRAVADSRADSVLIDNFGALHRGTQHLIAAGHGHIGYVGGTYTLETGAARLAGYEAAMRDAALEPSSASGANRIEGGMKATEELLSQPGQLTALVVATNLRTIGVLRVLRAHGLKVPEDIALVTVDDPFWAELVDPPLTTLAQPVRQMAETAVELLVERMRGTRTEPARVVFECELRVRRSCGTALPSPYRRP